MKVPAKISTKRKLVVGTTTGRGRGRGGKAEEKNYQEKERGMSPCQTHLITVLRVLKNPRLKLPKKEEAAVEEEKAEGEAN
ncbi:Hypothetical predicted protein [Mytilus galloprovincialis]|uniref:Uncharacterized protein n=1 Tax=Mytilus galloprovincialis TaxID=29158 RepID=A0A8B6BNH7_MYTGA|nr:Hypothetical predicted protein [Mytilus galloprovincialis]